MPINAVNSPTGGLGLAQSRTLAETLTDAVLVPEVGQFAPPARVGFQVHFVERRPDVMAIGGRLLADVGPEADVMVIDVAVMDGDWRQEVRAAVIERTLAAMADGRWPMADACGLDRPSPTWWGNFRVSDEGSRGPSGGVLSVLPLLGTGVFTESKARPSAPHWVRAPAPPGPGVRTPAGPRPGRFAVAPAMRAWSCSAVRSRGVVLRWARHMATVPSTAATMSVESCVACSASAPCARTESAGRASHCATSTRRWPATGRSSRPREKKVYWCGICSRTPPASQAGSGR